LLVNSGLLQILEQHKSLIANLILILILYKNMKAGWFGIHAIGNVWYRFINTSFTEVKIICGKKLVVVAIREQ
jgi:hypothetical protein